MLFVGLEDPVLLLYLLIGFLVGFTIHESSHALMAYALGDPTAKNKGRLTLNPLAHLHPLGTLSILLLGLGWGKPVPVDATRLRPGPKVGMALVGLAGPELRAPNRMMLPSACLQLVRLRQAASTTHPGCLLRLPCRPGRRGALGLRLILLGTLRLLGPDCFDPVKCFYSRAICNLAAAIEPAGYDNGAFFAASNSREDTLGTYCHRHFVLVLRVAERLGQTATTRSDLVHRNTVHAPEQLLHRRGAVKGLLMAMAVDEDLLIRRGELAIQVPFLDLLRQEDIDHHYVLLYPLTELLVVDQVGQVVGQGRRRGRLADHHLEPLLNEHVQIAEGLFAFEFCLSQKSAGYLVLLRSASLGEGNLIAARFE